MPTTVSLKNISQPAPITFQKIDKAVSLLSNAAIAILLGMGYKDSAPLMLILKIGVSSLMSAIGAVLGEDSTTTTVTTTPTNLN